MEAIMQATVLAAAVAAVLALPAAAQQRDQPPAGKETAQTVNLPPSAGIVLDFKEIDRNSDRSISVEEWNAFIESLRARTAQRGSAGSAGSGATTTETKR
jgi:hypothetical protein